MPRSSAEERVLYKGRVAGSNPAGATRSIEGVNRILVARKTTPFKFANKFQPFVANVHFASSFTYEPRHSLTQPVILPSLHKFPQNRGVSVGKFRVLLPCSSRVPSESIRLHAG